MITEDYVSFETAKVLKEKGFDVQCRCFMSMSQGFKTYCSDSFNYNNKLEFGCVSCPTLQMAMKWLREDKKILISIFCHIDKGYWFCIEHFIDSPYKFATSESIHRKEEILGKIQYYDTYEQACEAAIKYCLENLI